MVYSYVGTYYEYLPTCPLRPAWLEGTYYLPAWLSRVHATYRRYLACSCLFHVTARGTRTRT